MSRVAKLGLGAAIICGCLTVASARTASADAVQTSCRFLEVMSQNRIDEVDETLMTFADRWVDESRQNATTQLSSLLDSRPFIGGSMYRVARLGEDFEQHVLVLRLEAGETAGMRLTYEWTPDGLALTGIDFKRNLEELTIAPFSTTPEPLSCP